MGDWNPGLYLRFEKERTQPAIDLAARIDKATPVRIIDIGCGSGNSTRVLRDRWPDAEITGLDSSPAMLEQAEGLHPGIGWVCADAAGDLRELGLFDVAFSNAAIQWVPDQAAVLHNMFGLLTEGGVIAVQVPDVARMPVHTELKRLAASAKWRDRFSVLPSAYTVRAAGDYYDMLSGLSRQVELWETDYFHIMDSAGDIVSWYSSTGLRPYLDCLPEEAARNEFLEDFTKVLGDAYPAQADGRILFPFTRIFFTASKAAGKSNMDVVGLTPYEKRFHGATARRIDDFFGYHAGMVGAAAKDSGCDETIKNWISDGHLLYIITRDAEDVGFIHICFRGDIAAWIEDIYVDSAFRSRGIASRAIDLAEDVVRRRRGYSAVCMDVAPRNANAMSLYHRLGYTNISLVTLRKELYDNKRDRKMEFRGMEFNY